MRQNSYSSGPYIDAVTRTDRATVWLLHQWKLVADKIITVEVALRYLNISSPLARGTYVTVRS